MPELPEVETTRRGIEPHIKGQQIQTLIIRDHRLRWPINPELPAILKQATIRKVQRRAKYLLLDCGHGTLIIHLGMSGSLRILDASLTAKKHDHVDIVFSNGQCLRFHDPRRFGALLWTTEKALDHPRLIGLGPEPLSDAFNVDWLQDRARGRKQAIKTFIMDSRIVVGVGNIYASEVLFLAGIHPSRAAGRIATARYTKLVDAIKQVLSEAITQGGTTLRDFTNSDGKPGYFAQSLNVYGRAGHACKHCGKTIKQLQQGQRSTYYCGHCQH